MMTYKLKFDAIKQQLLGALSTYYLWKTLRDSKELYLYNKEFWWLVIPALQNEWFMVLARLHESSQWTKSGKVLSIFSLLQDHPDTERAAKAYKFLNDNSEILSKIKSYRHNINAHNNLEVIGNKGKFEADNIILYSEIESFFNFTSEMLSILENNNGVGYMLEHIKDEAKFSGLHTIQALKYFELKKKNI